ncbi:sensor histidine kinase [Haloplanus aerogenes]|uniref:histidine kinase n=1 Tax=Haloplanus aerogenes TaxID=660522 RepID=A0A3M0CU95_9EURY|nr:HAMP domain-containing sensor histidine kinase [Haloplanus aerogenes]AZH26914.1 sensor histidine kinase [Haloplanus aerogenes]RMB12565.1 signal transduction histidine kinase [Haloplanus aerogenes]
MAGLLTQIDRTLVRLFEAGPDGGRRRRERLARFGACTAVSLTGVALFLPNLTPYLASGQPAVGLGLGALGVVVCLGLIVAGALLYRSGFSTPNAVRIAVWNFLGLVVLGGVILGHGAYRGALGTVTTADALAAGNVLAISAAAHVIIGVHDARRVRAEQLAREREKFAVLSRVLRHNLRNDATVLIGQSERLVDELDGSLAETADALHQRSRTVGGLAEKTKTMVEALDRRSTPNARLNVHDVATDAVDEVREVVADEADVDITVDVPTNLWIWADDRIETALAELVENAVEHGGSDIRVTATTHDGTVDVRVEDDGPGIPDDERAILSGDTEITQLKHGSGLGLWVARSVAEAANGELTFDTDGERTVVRLAHDRAESPVEAAGDPSPAAAT